MAIPFCHNGKPSRLFVVRLNVKHYCKLQSDQFECKRTQLPITYRECGCVHCPKKNNRNPIMMHCFPHFLPAYLKLYGLAKCANTETLELSFRTTTIAKKKSNRQMNEKLQFFPTFI